MAKRPQIGLNLPPDVEDAWIELKGPFTNSRMGMACLAAYALLDDQEARDLGNLIAAVDEERADWSRVVEWIDQMRARRAGRATRTGRRLVARTPGKGRGKR